MLRFWISWIHSFEDMGEFELHSPWWYSGVTADGDDQICAAVMANSEEAAKQLVRDSYDSKTVRIAWRFCEERPNDWSPYCDRFRRAKWMKWPDGKSKDDRV